MVPLGQLALSPHGAVAFSEQVSLPTTGTQAQQQQPAMPLTVPLYKPCTGESSF